MENEKDVFDEVLEELEKEDEEEKPKELIKENKKKKQILFGNWSPDKSFE